ncbi:10 kDa chaperonin [Linum perenne]
MSPVVVSVKRCLFVDFHYFVPAYHSNSSYLQLNSGKVVAVGPGIRDKEGKHIPVAVKEGDTVLLPEYGGMEVKLGDKE